MISKAHYLESTCKLKKCQQHLLIYVFGRFLPVIYMYYQLTHWDLLPDGASHCYQTYPTCEYEIRQQKIKGACPNNILTVTGGLN